MYEIVRVLVYRLWVVSTFTVFSSFIIFWLYGVLTALMVLTFGIMGILYAAQDLLLYFPNEPPDSRVLVMQPSHYKLPFESIKLKTKDGLKIHMFLVLQASDSHRKPTMIFFHGNAGNMGQRLGNVSGFYHKLNINILVVEYRGYGLSEGAPSEPGLYVDAQSALEYLLQRSDIDNSQIIVFGRSLGGAVAIDLAARPQYRDRLWALIVENTFTSIPDMARVVLKWRCLSWLPMFCHKNKYMSVRKMCRVRASTLVVCGSRDALVPPHMSHALLVRCGAVVRRHVTLPGAHDDTWTCAEYYTELRRFLALLPPFAPPAWPRAPRAVHTV